MLCKWNISGDCSALTVIESLRHRSVKETHLVPDDISVVFLLL